MDNKKHYVLFINKLKIVLVGKLLWYKNTLSDMQTQQILKLLYVEFVYFFLCIYIISI